MQTATERSTWPPGESEMAGRIRACDWAATPLGSVDAWPESLKAVVGVILAAPHPMWIGWGAELIQLYNDGYRALLDEDRHPALLGQPAAASWAEIWHLVDADFESILGGGPAVSYEDRHVPHRRHGKVRDLTFTYSYSPIPDAGAPNGVGGVLCLALETTDRVLAERAVRESEVAMSRFAALADASAEFVGMCDELLRPFYVNPAGLRLVGLESLEQARRTSVLEYFFPEDQAFIRDMFLPQVLRDGQGEVEIRFRHFGTGEALWVSYSVVSLPDGHGRITGYGTVTRDITARRRVETELRESEARQAFLLSLGDALRPLADPARIEATASQLLAEYLSGALGDTPHVDEDPEPVTVRFVVHDGYEPSSGQPFVAAELGDWAGVPESVRSAYRAHHIRAIASIPLVRHGRLMATLGVISTVVPEWTRRDVELFRQVAERAWDTIGRARAETILREEDQRQAFLLAFSDAMRPLTDATRIQMVAARILGEKLGASRAFYLEYDAEGAYGTVAQDYAADGASSLAGRYPYEAYRTIYTRVGAGRAWVVADVAAEQGLAAEERESLVSQRVMAWVDVPLVKQGQLVAVLCVTQDVARTWTDAEVALVEAAAERSWAAMERARAEAALRASEERLRALVTASSYVIYRMSPDWSEMRQLDGRGFLADTAESVPNWTDDYIEADDRPRVLAAIEAAIRDKCMFELEHRVRRADGTVGWTLSRAVPILDDAGEIVEWFGAASDVTERRQAEMALRESEERLRLALDVAELGMWTWDLDTGEGEIDPRGAEIVGLPPGPVRNTAAAQDVLAHPDDLAALQATVEAGIAQGEAFALNYRAIRPDGALRHVSSRARVITDASGRPARLIGTNRDVTAEREAEDALRDSEAHLRLAMDAARMYAWDYDLRTMAMTFSDNAERILGRPPATTYDEAIELLHPDDRAVVDRAFADAIDADGTFSFEVRMPEPDGDVTPYLISGTIVRDEAGEPTRARGVSQDITARKRIEEQLRASEERLRRMINIEGVGVLVFDTDGTLIEANDHFLAMTGYGRDRIAARELNWRRLTPETHLAATEAQMRRLRETGRIGPYEKEYLLADGSTSWMLIAGASLGDGTFVKYCIDVSDRKQAEATLRQIEAALRESEARHAFLLRLTDTLRQASGSEEQQRMACTLLGEHLGADRVQYAEHRIDEGIVVALPDYARPDARSLGGSSRLGGFGEILSQLRAGRTVVVADTQQDPLLSEPARAACRELHIGACIAAPLLRGGELAWTLTVISDTPRAWSAGEVALVEEAGERTWIAVERGHAEADLAARVQVATAELRAVSRRLLEVQEDERRHLARELHDEIGQMLTGLSLNLRPGASGRDDRLEEARRIVHELTHQVRQLSMELRPSALDSHGLLPALVWHIGRFQDRTGVRVDLRHEGMERRFPPAVEIAAYRIVQEALTNVARHAGVRRATVQLLADAGVLIVSVRDRGRGIDRSARVESGGVSGMRERARLVGGTLSIDSAPGEGTVITAELPIDDPHGDDPGEGP